MPARSERCPPSGSHHYFIRLFSTGDRTQIGPGASHEELRAVMEKHILDRAELMVTYKKRPRVPPRLIGLVERNNKVIICGRDEASLTNAQRKYRGFRPTPIYPAAKVGLHASPWQFGETAKND